MAEAIVSLVVEKIADLLIEEGEFLYGVRDGVQRLQDELKRMQCFLKDADRRQDQDKRIQNWIAEIRDLAYDAEDVIDTFLLKAAPSHTGVHRFIKKATSIFTKFLHLRDIGNQIEFIQVKIGDITRSMQTYGINTQAEGSTSSVGEMHHRLRRSYPHNEEEHVISFDAVAKDLRAQLMIEEERLCVVSIVGMGGLGKTTLAKKVYNDSHVKQQFDCSSWAFISQQFAIKDVMVGIMMGVASSKDKSRLDRTESQKLLKFELERMNEEQKFKSILERMKEEDLVEELHKVLEQKRYLVVLDDIWTIEAWNCLKPAFPNGKKGSKILFTTRNKEVALFANPRSSPVEPPLLTNDEGWKLLSRKALVEDGCAPEFEKLGRKMVERCGGLPLAIVVLGGLLATKKSLRKWQVVHGNIDEQFIKLQQHQQYGGVYGILALSYHDLPFHLKPCFLYLSQFPEDSEFHKRTLIRMWIAEGFVSQPLKGEAEQTMEDVGEEYLEELVSRCMVQVSQRDHTGIGVKTCRIHDMVRDMCISKARVDNFLGVIEHRDEKDAAYSGSSIVHSEISKSRRITIHPRISRHVESELFYVPLLKNGDQHFRSLFYFVERGKYQMTRQQQIYIVKTFRLLRVLKFENIDVRYITVEIGNLIHLRYLGLRYVGLQNRTKCIFFETTVLPASIGNLRSLYTLDLRGNPSIKLPDVLWKLESLRHLLVDDYWNRYSGNYDNRVRQLHTLKHLETLKMTKAKYLIQKDAMVKLTNLRKLGISFEEAAEVNVLLKSPIFELGRLRSLYIKNYSQGPFPVEPFSNLHHLTKLTFYGALHDNLEYLPASLAKLILMESQLKQDPMEVLEKLPNLRFLSLDNAYKGSKMVCSACGFPQLEILVLKWLCYLEEWEIEEGAMPCLKTLSLDYLWELRMIPEGFKFINTLRELKLNYMKQGFERRVEVIDEVEGDDFHKVRHIPSISTINYPLSQIMYIVRS